MINWINHDSYATEGNRVGLYDLRPGESYVKVKTIQSKLIRSMFEEQQD